MQAAQLFWGYFKTAPLAGGGTLNGKLSRRQKIQSGIIDGCSPILDRESREREEHEGSLSRS
jgi:hypothetical protein